MNLLKNLILASGKVIQKESDCIFPASYLKRTKNHEVEKIVF